jgi:LPXTG-motif cell wall-anchored protein
LASKFGGSGRFRRRKVAALIAGASLVGLSLIAAQPASAAPNGAEDAPFTPGVYSSAAQLAPPEAEAEASGSAPATTFSSVQLPGPTVAPVADSGTSQPGVGPFNGLAYDPVTNYQYATAPSDTDRGLTVTCGDDVPDEDCNIDTDVTTNSVAPQSSTGTGSGNPLENLLGPILPQLPTKTPAVIPQDRTGTVPEALPNYDLYQLDADGDLSDKGTIAPPTAPTPSIDPNQAALTDGAVLGDAGTSTPDGTYVVPGVQISITEDETQQVPTALEPTGLETVPGTFESEVVAAGLTIGAVDPDTAATAWSDVDLSASSCAGVPLMLFDNWFASLFGAQQIYGQLGGLLDWAIRPSDGKLYAWLTPGLLSGLLAAELGETSIPANVLLVVDPTTGVATCTPTGTIDLTADSFPINPVGGAAWTENDSLLLWETLTDTYTTISGSDLDAFIASGDAPSGIPTGIGSDSDQDFNPLAGDLSSDPWSNLAVTPTVSDGSTPPGPFGFTISDPGYDPQSLNVGDTARYVSVSTATALTLTETPATGYTLQSVTCTIDGQQVTPTVAGNAVTITIATTDPAAACTFVNVGPPPVAPPPAAAADVVTPTLANTGAHGTTPLTIVGLGLLLAGAGLLLLTRRREQI